MCEQEGWKRNKQTCDCEPVKIELVSPEESKSGESKPAVSKTSEPKIEVKPEEEVKPVSPEEEVKPVSPEESKSGESEEEAGRRL
jgi:hypothetical protein